MKRTSWMVVSSILVVSLVFAACGPTTTTPAPATPTAPVTPSTPATPTTPITPATPIAPVTPAAPAGVWWDKFGKPQYGGTITARLTNDVQDFDPWIYTLVVANDLAKSMVMETLGMINWTLNREEYSGAFLTRNRDETVRTGLLAGSWEAPDLQTVIFRLRKGVRWQDKPPVSGREFTADDVVYHYSRQRGLGKFTTGSPTRQHAQYAQMKSVTALDKYTVEFKWSTPSVEMLNTLLDDFGYANIVAHEVIDRYGDIRDWRNAVGTGPWIINDNVPGSILVFKKNPTYWGYSEWYPENRLPYADWVRFMIIPDTSTAQAALRTGKIDMLSASWEDAVALRKTNPEIMNIYAPGGGVGISLKVTNKPFDDIRVRQALQMAIDRKTIAQNYYGGLIDDTPYGQMGPAQQKGWYTPYAAWPQELKDTYAYNPDGAKKLLAQAGFPNGFKTEIVLTATNVDTMSIAKDYFAKIGVDVEFKVMETGAYNSLTRAGNHRAMMPGGVGGINPPMTQLNQRYSSHPTNNWNVNDPAYDKMVDEFYVATSRDIQKKLVLEADMYIIQQQWTVILAGYTVSPQLYQPWLKGYSGETYNTGYHYARFWVDQQLKKTMGR